jgi:hypothetical protein
LGIRVLIVEQKIIEIGRETMRKLTEQAKEQIDNDPFYKVCARHKDGNCAGRITIEHALIFAHKQVDLPFALIPLCEFHHSVNKYQDCGDLNKEKNEWIALSRATEQEITQISKAVDYKQKLKYLNNKYGIYS